MRKKMRKYQPGGTTRVGSTGPAGPYTATDGEPPAPPVSTPPNVSVPANASQPLPPEAPVAPITSNATGQAPAMDPLLAAQEKWDKFYKGKRPGRARRKAMKEVNPLNKQKVSGATVLNTIKSGLDLANQSTNVISAARKAFGQKNGGQISAFQKNGGQMSGKELRKTSGFMKEGGSVARKATRSAKKYDQAAKAYSKGKMAKGDRKMAKGNKLAVVKKPGIKTRKR